MNIFEKLEKILGSSKKAAKELGYSLRRFTDLRDGKAKARKVVKLAVNYLLLTKSP